MNNPNLLILLFFIATISSCIYDEDVCNTVEVSYADEIVPLIDANCFSCHEDEDNYTGLCLATYALVSDSTTLSHILERIQLDLNDDDIMPPNTPLSDCQIDIFKAWVEQGAQNN